MNFFVFLCLIGGAFALTAKEELDLTPDQKKTFEEFKKEMLPEIKNNNMKKDIYLVKFFRANDFDNEKAKLLLKIAIQWREEYKMDTIHTEDLARGLGLFEVHTKGVDKEGSVVLYLQTGHWELQNAINNGEKDYYKRTVHRFLEDTINKVLEKYEAGGKTAQYSLVLNYDGWTSIQGACIECVALVSEVAINVDFKWPGWLKKLFCFNTAADFRLLMDVVKPLLAPNTQKSLEVYGTDKKEWMGALEKHVAKDQLEVILQGKGGFKD